MMPGIIFFLIAGILFSRSTARNDGDARLIGGGNVASRGRVEVQYSGIWGTVHDDSWDLQDANVVCRQLGYGGAVAAPRYAAFGKGTGVIWMSDVQCTGNETSISTCRHRGLGVVGRYSHHYNDASAVCIPAIRLVGGPSAREGLVQVYYNNTWGSVCAQQWDNKDADVVCRMLGYSHSLSATQSSAAGGQGNDTIWLDNVQCVENESSFFSCLHGRWKNHSCANSQRAGMTCSIPQVRLVGGYLTSQGRVEVLYGGVWGRVCRNSWDILDANVVCRQLGYERADEVPRNAAFSQGTGVIWMSDVQCKGNETSLSECRHIGWGEDSCHYKGDASTVCIPTVRLVGEPSDSKGLVQVYYNNTWGLVCAQQWDKQDADVVCRMLGYPQSSSAFQGSAAEGPWNETISLNHVDCDGQESSILSCVHGGWSTHSCSNRQRAGVVCSVPEVRLVGGGNVSFRGRVEVQYGGVWGTICDDYSWDLQDANVVCRQLGYEGAVAAPGFAAFGKGTGVIWMSDVQCTGNETSISTCRHRGNIRGGYCSHYYDASAVCIPTSLVAVRLLGGSSGSKGQVQVYYNNTWGSVCAQQWDKQDAYVVCRIMGYKGEFSAVQKTATSGQGNDTIWLNNVQCVGYESSLYSCGHDGWRNHSCANSQIAGVVCNGGEVRLVGGHLTSQGRVEIFHDGVWGRVCGLNGWNLQSADVVCRQLGYERAEKVPPYGTFGYVTGKIWMSDVQCTGNEMSISQCRHRGWEVRDCRFYYDAGAVCIPAVRLVGERLDSAGFLQVYYNNTWGSVCAQQWDNKDADVVCRMLGYPQSSSAVQSTATGGQGYETTWLNNVDCNGHESSIFLCVHGGWRNHSCTNSQRAAVKCSVVEVRLVGGGNVTFQGRVEVLYGGVWGAVCSYLWDLQDANVVCRQLGYDGAVAAPRYAAFGRGTGVILMGKVQCTGNEKSISECDHYGWGVTKYCDNPYDASAVCVPAVRLVGGSLNREGLVQVYYNSTWGSVCAQQWDNKDADVVCRMLGYTGSLSAVHGGAADGQMTSLNNLQCVGNESSIFSCVHDGWRNHSCTNDQNAGVICSVLQVRLVGGHLSSQGRVEVFRGGVWGSVCGYNSGWSQQEANVVCRQLGYESADEVPHMEHLNMEQERYG